MGLTKWRLGDLIEETDERNYANIFDKAMGINIKKQFMLSNLSSYNLKNYKIVHTNEFAYSAMQTGRDGCIRLAIQNGIENIIVSPAYVTFHVLRMDVLIPEYFFMLFLSKEMDRYGSFRSDGSIRANLDWDIFCNIELNLPSIEIQRKYVAIYRAMQENQRKYESGLEDLKLLLDATLDKIKHTVSYISVGALLEEVDERNSANEIKHAMGINIQKIFMPSNLSSSNLSNYKIVHKNEFAYSAMQTGRDKSIRIALQRKETPIIVSPAYSILRVKNDNVLPEYIMMWFSRHESDRYGWFLSDGSVRANLDLPVFFNINIPLPDINTQKSLVQLYQVYQKRKSISEQLKEKIQSVCPILIRGAMLEAQNQEA